MKRHAWQVAVVVVVAFATGTAHAGNRFSYMVGGRAAGMGGAVASLVADGSAAWYNPAGLANTDRHSFDLSASAYGLEMLRVSDLVESRCGGVVEAAALDTAAFAIVPTSLDMVYRLSEKGAATRHMLALSVFAPEYRSVTQSFDSAPCGTSQKFRVEVETSVYAAGPSYAVNIGEHVNLGVSLLGVYGAFQGNSSYHLHIDDSVTGLASDAFSSIGIASEETSIGLTLVAGAQLRWAGFRAGLVLRTPVFEIYGSQTATETTAAADPTTGAAQFDQRAESGDEWGFTPAGPVWLTAAVGYEIPGVFSVGVDVHWHTSYDPSDDLDTALRHTINAAVGFEVYLTESLPLAFGFFTDFHPERDREGFGAAQVDYYGGSVALTILSPYDVTGSDKTDRIVFATTIGLHYAYGTGDMEGLAFDFDADSIVEESRSLNAHDVHVFLASSVRF